MKNVSDNRRRDIQNTHFEFSNFFYENCAVYEIKNCTAREAANHSIVWPMRFACWITQATDTHLEFILLIAFPRQQWLR